MKEWNVLLTRYRRGRQAEKVTKSSGAGIDDVFDSNWEHFQQITFLESTPETNSPLSALDKCEITHAKSLKLLKKVTLELHCISPSQRALINPLPHN